EMVRILRGGTLEQALAFYDSVKTHSTGQYDLQESELNRLGYYLLSRERADEAIVIFKLNVDNYPESANVYDSLGDAYRDAGRIDEAISSYQKVLKLDPDGEFGRLAREAIAELERKTD
ncbi:MAG: tetratricopeptide repeat protein, partial [Calditrichota bacterium]